MWRIVRPDSYTVWGDAEVRRRLDWYYRVMRDEAPANFMIAGRIPLDEDVEDLSLEELWRIHSELTSKFDKLKNEAVERGWDAIDDLEKPKRSFLDLKAEIARRILRSCVFCERRCGANREAGEVGTCRLNSSTYVTSWFHHYGEEAPLVPSGTIFYGSCNFRCVYCQNHDISQEHPHQGMRVDGWKLALIMKDLRRDGARNINHVGGDPTPNLHTILDGIRLLDVNVPQLWNSNMYCSLETMRLLREVIDIWLPDLKYGSDKCAVKYSAAPRYWEIATRNIKLAHEWGDIIVRHLVMPNHLECCTKPILKWISMSLPRALVNVMEQYRPEYLVLRHPERWPEIARRPTRREIEEAYKLATSLGIVWEPVS